MTIITLRKIDDIYKDCLSVAVSVFELRKWVHYPAGIEIDTHKSKYGQATSDGIVKINPAFIGTTALNKLKETIFHELAHLIVGLDKHHNKLFRLVEKQLTQGLIVTEEERQQVKLNNGYKFKLLAHGKKKVYDCGGAFRRTKKYANYKPEGGTFMSIEGDKIERFEYVTFDKPN